MTPGEAPGLEDRLRDLCHVRGERESNLDLELAKVRQAQRRNWEPVTLKWFTDHTSEGHSRRIIDLLEQMFDGDDVLTPNELFVLLAACYLHDLGMQYAIIDGRDIETMDSSDWGTVRKRHPEWSRKLIIERTLVRGRDDFEIGLSPESDFLEAIAIVAESHGSQFFERNVSELEARKLRPGNEPARLMAVAALLLMADELDLHRRRVEQWPRDTFRLSPTGQLHFHVHDYVGRVTIARSKPSANRRVELGLSFPVGSAGYRELVVEWLARRLLKQIRRTNPVLLEGLDGAFVWDERITIDSEIVPGPVRRALPPTATRLLEVEVAEERLVGRAAIREELRAAIEARSTSCHVVGLRGGASSDVLYLLRWVEALARMHATFPLHIDLTMREGYDYLDLPSAVRHIVAEGEPFRDSLATGDPVRALDLGGLESADTPESVQDCLVDTVRRGDAILILQRPSAATARTAKWARELIERASKGEAGFVLVIDASSIDLPEGSASHNVTKIRVKQVETHLRERLGYPDEVAREEAEMMMQLSGGSPARISHEMVRRVTAHVDESQ
jgi:hypothetical protein